MVTSGKDSYYNYQAANLKVFHASVNHRFEGEILDFIYKFNTYMDKFNTNTEKYTGKILN